MNQFKGVQRTGITILLLHSDSTYELIVLTISNLAFTTLLILQNS